VITLNSDKGLVKIEYWDDIEARPGFEKNVNPGEVTLDAIIGRYIFKEKIRCGLSNCHTPHARGYIVSTKDGRETNIGKDCGKRYFGVDFEDLSKKFDRDVTESNNREALWSFRFQLDELEDTIHALHKFEQGANWVYKCTRPLITVNKGCPIELVHKISAMVKSRNNMLSLSRQATEQETERLEVSQNKKIVRPHFIDEPIAEIIGLEPLYPENDLRKLLNDLEENLKTFKEKDIDSMTFEELKHWVKWKNSIDNTLENIQYSLSQGQKLLNPENLMPFKKILSKNNDEKLFMKYLKSIKSGVGHQA
jgi:hypothetical protein